MTPLKGAAGDADTINDADSDAGLDEEQRLMRSMGLPVAFASDMLRITDTDDENQVQNSIHRANDLRNV